MNNNGESKKNGKTRCAVCNKKLVLDYFNCSCSNDQVFCSSHRFPSDHQCTFDFKKVHKERIRKTNPKVMGEKLVLLE